MFKRFMIWWTDRECRAYARSGDWVSYELARRSYNYWSQK